MNNFKHYAVALLSCVAVAGIAKAAIPEAGFIKNDTEEQAVVTVLDKSGNKLIDEAGLAPKEKIQVDENFDKITAIQVKLGTATRPTKLTTCYHSKVKGAMPLSSNTQYDMFVITNKRMDNGKLHIECKNSAARHEEGFQEVREVKRATPVRYKRISGRAATGCATCGEVVEPACSTCGR